MHTKLWPTLRIQGTAYRGTFTHGYRCTAEGPACQGVIGMHTHLGEAVPTAAQECSDVHRCGTHTAWAHRYVEMCEYMLLVHIDVHKSSLKLQTYSHVCAHRWKTGALRHMQDRHQAFPMLPEVPQSGGILLTSTDMPSTFWHEAKGQSGGTVQGLSMALKTYPC